MPRVTRIEVQQHDPNRYSVFLDGDYSFSLLASDLLDRGLHQDQEITPAELEELKRRSDEGKAYDKALGYLSFRQRTRVEMERYLAGKGYEEAAITGVLERLLQQKLIDDAQFAGSWVRDRQNLRPRSRRQLAMELRAKGVDRDTIDQQLDELGDEGEEAAIKAIIEKKAARMGDDKLVQYLLQRGFKYDLIRSCLSPADDK